MANSTITYIADGTTTQFALNFKLGILNRAHVTCRVGNETNGSGQPVYRELSWITDSLVNVLGSVPANGTTVRFDRTVPKDILYHDYVNGAPITDDNLNQSNMQSIMAIHEILDGRLADGYIEDLNMNSKKITNLAAGVNPNDAINLTQLQDYTGNAPTYAAQAAASAVSAAASAAIASNADSVAGALYGTSPTSRTVATGSTTFTTQAGKAFAVGVWLLIASAANPTNFMHGQVTSYSGTLLTVNVTNKGGTGTFADWVISVSGVRGITGTVSNINTLPVGTAVGDDLIPFSDISDSNTVKQTAIQPLLNSLLPSPFFIGEYRDLAGSAVPSKWLLCDGSAVNRSTYSQLFSVIGTTYGSGDGSTTFNLPDARRRVLVGSGGTGTSTLANTVGSIGGAERHTLTVNEMPEHDHREGGNHENFNNVSGAGGQTSSIPVSGLRNSGSGNINTVNWYTFTAGSGQSHNNMQPSLVSTRIIYAGV